MHFSINLESVFRNIPMKEALRTIAALGYDTCERWTIPQAQEAALADGLQANGLHLSAFCPDSFVLNDPAQRDAYAAAIQSACERAKRVGATELITQTGMDTGRPLAEQYASITEGLRQVVPILEAAGVTLLIEPLNTVKDHIGYGLSSSEDGFRIVEAVDSRHVRLLFDIYHQLHMEEDVLAQIHRGLPLIGHFHVAGFPARDERLFEGFDYRPVFDVLQASGTQALVGLEFFPSDQAAAQEMLQALRAYQNT